MNCTKDFALALPLALWIILLLRITDLPLQILILMLICCDFSMTSNLLDEGVLMMLVWLLVQLTLRHSC